VQQRAHARVLALTAASAAAGRGPVEIKLQDVSELAVQHGFVKKGAPEQADLTAFFKAHDCNALSTFRKRFCEQPLEPVTAGTTAAATAAVAQARLDARALCRLPCLSVFQMLLACGALTRLSRPPSFVACAQPSARIAQVQCTPEPLERYPELLAKWQDLSWRLVKKPGAAHTKPDDYYRLQAVAQQVRRCGARQEQRALPDPPRPGLWADAGVVG